MQHVSRGLPAALAAATALTSVPASIRAEGDPQALFAQIQSTLGDIRSQTDGRLTALEETNENVLASLSAMQGQIESGGISPQGGAIVTPAEPEYTRTFASYIHRGEGEAPLREANATGQRQIIQASMSVGDNSSGGYLAPTEWDRQVMRAQRAVSPMRRLANVQAVSVGAYHTLWSNDQAQTGWVGEIAARPQTTTPQLSKLDFASGEIYANAAATQTLLDDALVATDASF